MFNQLDERAEMQQAQHKKANGSLLGCYGPLRNVFEVERLFHLFGL
jgi:hypothetical protein